MQIRVLSIVTAASLSLCFSWATIAQSSPKPESGDSSNQRTSETITEDTSSQELKPTQTDKVPKAPNSADGTPTSSETSTDSEVIRIQQMRTGEGEKPSSEAVESIENQTGQEVTPTDKKPATSVPNTLKK